MEPVADLGTGSGPILSIDHLYVNYSVRGNALVAVNDVSFALHPGEILAIVGESGSGKSQILLAILRLLGRGSTTSGSIRFQGCEIFKMTEEALDRVRGARIAAVFQDPMTALNPFLSVATQLIEVLARHQRLQDADARRAASEMLQRMRISEPDRIMRSYPHELSGGMRQRVCVAMALLSRPAILLADEPTTALDVTVQAHILELIRELARQSGTAVILVTHDLGVVASISDRVIVLYGGRIMEVAGVEALFSNPQHPYTQALLRSVPRLDEVRSVGLRAIPGQASSTAAASRGCPFEPRCERRLDSCRTVQPVLQRANEHAVACLAVDK